MQQQVQKLIKDTFGIRELPRLSNNPESRNLDKYVYLEDFIIAKGLYPPEKFDEKEFVITNSFKALLTRLSSIVAITNYAVIL
jgi:hypothetical protein